MDHCLKYFIYGYAEDRFETEFKKGIASSHQTRLSMICSAEPEALKILALLLLLAPRQSWTTNAARISPPNAPNRAFHATSWVGLVGTMAAGLGKIKIRTKRFGAYLAGAI
jgi:hypothetical protein